MFFSLSLYLENLNLKRLFVNRLREPLPSLLRDVVRVAVLFLGRNKTANDDYSDVHSMRTELLVERLDQVPLGSFGERQCEQIRLRLFW